MELYTKVAYENSRHVTLRYSTSFGISSRLFEGATRDHIYAIYALVRIADEIVDTYKKGDARTVLDTFEKQVYASMSSGFSTDLVIHAFAQTANRFTIEKSLIKSFFESMRMDLLPHTYKRADYDTYIYGSAEVVGLMCLRVFTEGKDARYRKLKDGAAALGAAYQKVNFLRDIAADYHERGRVYFPNVTFETFDDSDKDKIITDIRNDFDKSLLSLRQLPSSCRLAVATSYIYYMELLERLDTSSAQVVKQTRIRVPAVRKIGLLVKIIVKGGKV